MCFHWLQSSALDTGPERRTVVVNHISKVMRLIFSMTFSRIKNGLLWGIALMSQPLESVKQTLTIWEIDNNFAWKTLEVFTLEIVTPLNWLFKPQSNYSANQQIKLSINCKLSPSPGMFFWFITSYLHIPSRGNSISPSTLEAAYAPTDTRVGKWQGYGHSANSGSFPGSTCAICQSL